MPIRGCFNVRNSEKYPVQEMFMTAFIGIYPEGEIMSLSEAVVGSKQSYNNYRQDYARLIKARKQTDTQIGYPGF